MHTKLMAATVCGIAAVSLAVAAYSRGMFNPSTSADQSAERSANRKQTPMTNTGSSTDPVATTVPAGKQQATFGSGCFWCTEAVFQQLAGVESVVSGYSGGRLANPTYEDICTGATGHAEVIQVTFDSAVVSYADLLEAFWRSHDPTTLNSQGRDFGTQYRSVIFYRDDEQRKAAEHYKQKIAESGAFGDPIVTEISPLENFYPAERDHQNYYNDNPRQGYCSFIIRPKLEKFRAAFADKLKSP
ncbi:MAG: peptide-methionine (S)-S-oxide reductase MsrA [Pirellulales bacterium]